MSFAWGRFRDNVGTWLAFMLISIAASLLVVFPMSLVFFAPVADSGSGTALVLTLGAAGVALIVLVGMLLQAALVRAALAESAQDRPSLRHFGRIRNLSQALLAMAIVAVLTFAGLLLFVLPGLLVAFFSMFAVHFAVDQNLSAIDAIKSSWRAVGANVGPLLLLVLVLYLINLAGALILIGFLVTVPVAAIAVALAYRRVTGTA
ncbi:hypothetical protein GCM10011410_27530 [Hoyosella rhizosphaerae]|uniref:DUF7847 domain-containing protein n=2 Tax=Hoyosella rhizosphaerae TaxID=1755582 RepID=A0A916UI07_9ACTN|nr:hypothetical protein GCM10011410_27530 [Hoyosella rhizosphaerae]